MYVVLCTYVQTYKPSLLALCTAGLIHMSPPSHYARPPRTLLTQEIESSNKPLSTESLLLLHTRKEGDASSALEEGGDIYRHTTPPHPLIIFDNYIHREVFF